MEQPFGSERSSGRHPAVLLTVVGINFHPEEVMPGDPLHGTFPSRPQRQHEEGPEVPDQVSPRDPAQLRDLGLLADEQPATDAEA
jgi:hypothetical protein